MTKMSLTVLALVFASSFAVAQEPPQAGDILLRPGAAATEIWERLPDGTWVPRKKPTPPTTVPSVPTSTTSSTTTSSSSSSSTTRPSTTSSTSSTTSSTTAPTLAPPTGATRYISPTGNDANTGLTMAAPWKSVSKAVAWANPGDSIALLDGPYPGVVIDCWDGGNARNGTKDLPITIRAVNERKAWFKSDGTFTAFEMDGCRWWKVLGIRASNQKTGSATPNGTTQSKGFPFKLIDLADVYLYRLLGHDNNVMQNTHVYALQESQRVTMEECEAWFYHRHAFSIWKSRFITLRRAYANSGQKYPQGCCAEDDNHPYGDEAFSFYGTSDSICENCVSENIAGGFQNHGGSNPFTSPGGARNKCLGCLMIDSGICFYGGSRSGGIVQGTVVENSLGLRCNRTHGAYFRQTPGTIFRNLTLWGGAHGGAIGDKDYGMGATCPSSLGPCSFTATNVLSVDNAGAGFSADYPDWVAEYSNAFGNDGPEFDSSDAIGDSAGKVRFSKSVAPTGMGPGQCLHRVPEGSNMKGAGKPDANGQPRDIGANIVNRYVNGTLTTQPLWGPDGFPCGAIVPGVNDGPQRCANVHTRLNVAGCH